MRSERLLYVIIISILALLIFWENNKIQNLNKAFLAGPNHRDIIQSSKNAFVKDQGVLLSEIDKQFYVAYSIFSDRICIRFVPKLGVRGGATSYCYDINNQSKLIGVDKTS